MCRYLLRCVILQKIDTLKKLYKNYKDVDTTVGGALESLAQGAQVGPTFLCILNEQFLRTKRSDRFWFENRASGFNDSKMSIIVVCLYFLLYRNSYAMLNCRTTR